MKCSNCRKELKVHPCAENNVDAYGGSALIVSLCCGAPFTVTRKPGFNYYPYYGEKKEDDWGHEIKVSHSLDKSP